MVYCCNSLENPIGIETAVAGVFRLSISCCNSLENPIGIETMASLAPSALTMSVATHWKTR